MKIKAIYVLGLALYSVCAPVGAKCDVNDCTRRVMNGTYGIKTGKCRNLKLVCWEGPNATAEQIKEWDSKGSDRAVKTRDACVRLAQAKPELTNEQWMKLTNDVTAKLDNLNRSRGVCSVFSNSFVFSSSSCTKFSTAEELQVWKVKGDQQKVAEAIERCKHMRSP
jgi:hypothetical protein